MLLKEEISHLPGQKGMNLLEPNLCSESQNTQSLVGFYFMQKSEEQYPPTFAKDGPMLNKQNSFSVSSRTSVPAQIDYAGPGSSISVPASYAGPCLDLGARPRAPGPGLPHEPLTTNNRLIDYVLINRLTMPNNITRASRVHVLMPNNITRTSRANVLMHNTAK